MTNRIRTRNVHLLVVLGALLAPRFMLAQVKYPDLSQQADGIAVGKIAAAPQNAAGARVILLVDRVLKGSFVPGQTVNILWDGAIPKRAPGQQWGDYGIWFLQSAGNANWRIIRVPASRSLEDSCYRLPEGSLAPAAPALNPAAPLPVDLVLAELSNAAETFDPHGHEFILTMEGFLHMPSSPSLSATFRRMGQSPKPHVKVLGLTGLIFHGDSTALDQLPLDTSTLAQLPRLLDGHLVGAVSMFRDPAPSTVTVLGRMATTEIVGIGLRQSAAEALAKIHTKDTLPFLATLLDAQDAILRNWAFDGFSRFVNNLPIEKPEMVTTMTWMQAQGPAPYRTTDTDRHIGGYRTPEDKHPEYVSFWKAWWSQMKGQVK